MIVIGSDGMVSLAAMRWLADQKAAFVMLDRDGSVLVATGPIGPRDARLRRAQALAFASGVAVDLSRDLINANWLHRNTMRGASSQTSLRPKRFVRHVNGLCRLQP